MPLAGNRTLGLFWPIRVFCMPWILSHAITVFQMVYTDNVIYGEHLLSLGGFGASVTAASHVGTMDWPSIKTLDNQAQVILSCWQDSTLVFTHHGWKNYAHPVWLGWEGTLGSCAWFPADFALCTFSLWDLTILFSCNKLYPWTPQLLSPYREPTPGLVGIQLPIMSTPLTG